jgi:transcriptional regulator with XRE-family HTH domain
LSKGSENLNSIVAPNVKGIIKDRCLKQSAVAKKAGYSEQQFSAMMNGRKVIKDIDILRIATALSVDANELFKKGDD